MTTTSAIVTDVNNFIADQDANRGQAVAGGGTLPTYYNVLTSAVVTGENAVTGIAGIASGAAAITLPSSQPGNAVIVDGAISTAASTSGTDSYSLLVSSSGTETLTDNNTGYSETITGAAYFVFNGGAKTPTGAYQSTVLVETGVYAEVASMYNAAFGRVPDFAGLEYNAIPVANGVISLHDLATDFLASPEFADLYLGGTGAAATIGPADNGGANDVAFINKLYGQILGRAPDATEVNYYVEALNGTLVVNGVHIPQQDRADLLIFFSISAENQADIAASNGGWLINPANGAVNLGALSSAAATTVLASEGSSGTINASDFGSLSTSADIYTNVSGGTLSVVGSAYGAGGANQQSNAEIASTAPNITINLSSEYILGSITGLNDTVNAPATGGAIIDLPSSYPSAAVVNNGGTVNLFGNINWIDFGTPYNASTVPAVINGWNSTDIIVGFASSVPSYRNTAASLLAHPDGTVLVGSASNPVSGSSISSGLPIAVAINVGTISNDSVAAIVTAANAAFHENGNALTTNLIESTFFFGQDPQGNTMVWYWRGDTTNAGTVLASDITGGVELVGVQASSLTGANFHH